jgi:hypothetical protein
MLSFHFGIIKKKNVLDSLAQTPCTKLDAAVTPRNRWLFFFTFFLDWLAGDILARGANAIHLEFMTVSV